jgi:hypothetical protein
MFQKALQIAAEFTVPIVVSRRAVNGRCSSSIGSAVIVNDEGWIATAAHVLSKWVQLAQIAESTQVAFKQRAAIKADPSLSKKERARALSAASPVGNDDSDRCSIFIVWPNVKLVDIVFYPAISPGWGEIIDFGVARLDPFDPAWAKAYPVFKDPTKNFEPGESLCELGFPFHQFQPSWDETSQSFSLPPGALPMPRFPIEGIFTRISEVRVPQGQEQPPFPI